MALDVLTKQPHSKSEYNDQTLIELMRSAEDPLYFMSRFMKIQHATLGAIDFTPYPFQIDMINAFHDHRFTVALTARQLGKTTCAAGYLLWRAMFVPDSTILLTANKLVQALEIMERIRYAYENLPDYIRAGITEYNKGNIGFDNGSRILSRATASDAGRGLAISLLYCDEFAFVPPNKANEFWTSIQPTLSTGGDCIITSTPKSDEDQFAQIYKGAIDNTDEYGNISADGTGKNGFYAVTVPWHAHPDRDEEWAKPYRQQLGPNRFKQEFECLGAQSKIQLYDHDRSFDENIADAYKMLKMAG